MTTEGNPEDEPQPEQQSTEPPVDSTAEMIEAEEETAEVLGVSLKTVRNDWRFAKAWLKIQIGEPSA